MLQSFGSQSVRYDWVTELNWTDEGLVDSADESRTGVGATISLYLVLKSVTAMNKELTKM